MITYRSIYRDFNLSIPLEYKDCILPIPLKYEELGEDTIKNNSLLEKGKLYSLQGEECEGFTMPTRVYQCKGICKEIKTIPLDAVVMKLVEGAEDTIFSLTRQDCQFLNLEFEPQLQLFPSNFGWKEVNRTTQQRTQGFTKNNMATYPMSPKYGTLRQMHIFIKDVFKPHSCVTRKGDTELIKVFYEKIISTETFIKNLYVKFKNKELQNKFPILWKFICPNPRKNAAYRESRQG